MGVTRFLQWLCGGLVLLTCSLSFSLAAKSPAKCQFNKSDRFWIQQAQKALTRIEDVFPGTSNFRTLDSVFFDTYCQSFTVSPLLNSDNWRYQLHQGQVLLPSRQYIPASTIAFMSLESEFQRQSFFVMSLPSVWQRARYDSAMGLETFLTAVLLHEVSHMLHGNKLMAKLVQLLTNNPQIKGFNDDSVQLMFQENRAFKRSLETEISLLLNASREKDPDRAMNFLHDAMALLSKRHQKWFVGNAQILRQAQPLWLTMEGMGQWIGYQWLISEGGARLGPMFAQQEFGLKVDAWSQQLGFALFIAAERFSSRQKLLDAQRQGQNIIDFIQLGILEQ